MSFMINTNVMALNALTNLDRVGNELSRSVQRLSTGLRINSGADDPAGLIISQEMQAQIGGITRAIQNNQDAINYAKTADGALSEVSGLLNDARTLAVSSGNTGVLDPAALQANQTQLQSIIQSITRIATNTAFGNKKILDGSAGVTASLTDAANFANLSFTGSFNGAAIVTNSAINISVTQAATQGSLASKTFAFGTTTVNAGSFTLNGVTFTTSSNETVSQVVQAINAAQGQTGVLASYTTGGAITLTQVNYGSNYSVTLTDANAVLFASASSSTQAGVDALANVSITTANGLVTVPFTGGKFGANGLSLADSDGNSILLTQNGNSVAAHTSSGELTVGSAQFQIGADAGQTATMSLGNFAASNLGTGVVANTNLSNLDVTTASGASTALRVIDQAIQQIATQRGDIGNFQRNVLEANLNSLNIANESLTATESSITDTNIASEMTNFTKLQILQQSGLAVLAQANQNPQAVLKLLG